MINVGSNAPASNSSVDNVTAALTISADAAATLNIDDSGNSSAKTVTLATTTLTGLAPATITYGAVATFNLLLGSGGNTLNVTGTNGTTNNINTGAGNDTVYVKAINRHATNINTGTGTNTLVVGSNGAGGNGVITNLTDALQITGSGTDIFTIDNAGDSLPAQRHAFRQQPSRSTASAPSVSRALQTSRSTSGRPTMSWRFPTPSPARRPSIPASAETHSPLPPIPARRRSTPAPAATPSTSNPPAPRPRSTPARPGPTPLILAAPPPRPVAPRASSTAPFRSTATAPIR